ncbi:MAG: DedA family protein [Phycisphaerales bacterium]
MFEELQAWLTANGPALGAWSPLIVLGLLLLSGFGIPVSEDVVNLPAGILIGQGAWPAIPILIACYVGVIAGDAIWFFNLRTFGTPLLHRRWFKRFVHPKRLLQVKHQIDRRGPWVLVAARFIPGARSPVLTASALLHMPWRSFLIVEFVCCLFTVPMQVGVGYMIGRHLGSDDLAGTVTLVAAVIVGVLLVSAAIPAVLQAWQSKHPLPRAKADWLRRYRFRKPNDRTPMPDGSAQPGDPPCVPS